MSCATYKGVWSPITHVFSPSIAADEHPPPPLADDDEHHLPLVVDDDEHQPTLVLVMMNTTTTSQLQRYCCYVQPKKLLPRPGQSVFVLVFFFKQRSAVYQVEMYNHSSTGVEGDVLKYLELEVRMFK